VWFSRFPFFLCSSSLKKPVLSAQIGLIWVMPEISEAIAAPQQNSTSFKHKLAQN
jgi:hypothetical protein